MDIESKIALIKQLDLMDRMDKHSTLNESKKIDDIINEAIADNRIRVSNSQILDILNDQSNDLGKFVSITYVNAKDVMKTKRSWRKDDVDAVLSKYGREGNEHWFDKLNDFNQAEKGKNPIRTVIAIMRYNLNWYSPESYARGYNKYASALRDLNMKNGIGRDSNGMLGDAHNNSINTGYGVYQGASNALKLKQNVAKAKVQSEFYMIDENGNIVGGIPSDVVRSISAVKKRADAPSVVQKALADNPEALKAYIEAKKELDADFRSQDFMLDKILCIVASVKGKSYYWINDGINTPIEKGSDVNVNREQLLNIMKEKVGETFQDVENHNIRE